jgi:hypothetical protein
MLVTRTSLSGSVPSCRTGLRVASPRRWLRGHHARSSRPCEAPLRYNTGGTRVTVTERMASSVRQRPRRSREPASSVWPRSRWRPTSPPPRPRRPTDRSPRRRRGPRSPSSRCCRAHGEERRRRSEREACHEQHEAAINRCLLPVPGAPRKITFSASARRLAHCSVAPSDASVTPQPDRSAGSAVSPRWWAAPRSGLERLTVRHSSGAPGPVFPEPKGSAGEAGDDPITESQCTG